MAPSGRGLILEVMGVKGLETNGHHTGAKILMGRLPFVGYIEMSLRNSFTIWVQGEDGKMCKKCEVMSTLVGFAFECATGSSSKSSKCHRKGLGI